MNRCCSQLQALLGANGSAAKALMAPLFIIMVLAMMVLPLPPFALDLLFTFNIAMALMVMVVAAYMVRPLDFAVFPTVILLTTLLRLSLNVASTRVVLIEGHTGPGAAGAVIESFGHFLIGGNFAVGLIVFAILVVINFIVITKGAERIAEVGARFTLDAMPGKQMAIDADLNAGLIDEKEAKRRRAEVGEEAEFFGSMDGASKYVRGDAMAGLLILLINIVGGFIIGVVAARPRRRRGGQQLRAAGGRRRAGGADSVAADLGRRGDGRLARRQGAGCRQPDRQAGLRSPRSLAITAGVIGLLGVIPGMPHRRLPADRRRRRLMRRGGCARAQRSWPGSHRRRLRAPRAEPNAEASWDDLQPVDTLGLEVGYRLIALVDKAREGDLLARIKGVRKKFAQDVGFLPPPVHIRDNLELKPSMYRLTLRGAVVGEGEAFPGMLLAINPGGATHAADRHHAPPIRPSACRRSGSRSASAKVPKWPDLPSLIARPSSRPIFHT